MTPIRPECPFCNSLLVPVKQYKTGYLRRSWRAFGMCVNQNCDAYRAHFARTINGDVYQIPCSIIETSGVVESFRLQEFESNIVRSMK